MCIGILQISSLIANCILFESVTPSIINNLNISIMESPMNKADKFVAIVIVILWVILNIEIAKLIF